MIIQTKILQNQARFIVFNEIVINLSKIFYMLRYPNHELMFSLK